MPSALSVKECLSYGWRTFRSRPWIFVQAGLLLFLVNILVNLVQQAVEKGGEAGGEPAASLVLLASALAGIAVSFLISMGETSFFLRAHDEAGSVAIRDLWHPHPFWKFAGASALFAIATILGLLLLIVPGVILSIMFGFYTYLVIEKELAPVEALKESAALTKGHRWELFLLGLAVIGINILGFLALVVGLFVTIPVSFLASVHAYRTLSEGKGEGQQEEPAVA